MGVAALTRDLFTYRLRMFYGEWWIMTNTGDIGPLSYQAAKREAKDLERRGYIDGDK